MTAAAVPGTAQSDGEGQEGSASSEKPSHEDSSSLPTSHHPSTVHHPTPNKRINGEQSQQLKSDYPMPSSDHPSSSAPTAVRGMQSNLPLDKLVMSPARQRNYSSDRPPVSGSATPSTIDSPSPSESESWSAPSTRPPSQVPSRAPSMSAGVSGNRLLPSHHQASSTATAVTAQQPTTQNRAPSRPPTAPTSPQPPSTPNRPRSASNAHSEAGKFSLASLISSAPKLSRKSSARSTGSSKKSDSDGERRSVTGDSAVSLTQKYGVCQKVAIGRGATSVVRLAHKWDRSEEKLYAVKEFRKRRKNESEKEYVKKLTAEFCISSTLHHVNIVETVDLVQDENKLWCEVMEFCPGGDLYAAIKKGGMSPSEVECCFKQILTGVSYLHSQGVAHRDIKPENLFFDTKGHLKIGDYGASTVYRLPWETTVHMSTGLCGSEPYIAPEQFLGKPYDARLVDIWACGIVYYCLHFQEMPWRVAQMSDTLYAAYANACIAHPLKDKDLDVIYPQTINNLSPKQCRSLIRRMLEPDPKRRGAIEDVMAHPWVKSIEVCHLVAEPKHVHAYAIMQAQAQFGGS
ncbi:Pkinase-domain-containing protein [Pisolithus marmoratus]|nr:Pkinase-domain-containing protein [Pisolithus marmoratus]